MTETTPRPWETDGVLHGPDGKGATNGDVWHGRATVEITGQDVKIADVVAYTDVRAGNAELIVKAINEYDTLAKTLVDLVRAVDKKHKAELSGDGLDIVDSGTAFINALLGARKLIASTALATEEK